MFRKNFSPLCAKDIFVFSVFFREARYLQRGVHSMHGKTSSHSGAGIDLKTDRSIRFTGPHKHSCVHQGYLSQKVTYLFCDELDIVSKELRSRVRQATKDVVKSEV